MRSPVAQRNVMAERRSGMLLDVDEFAQARAPGSSSSPVSRPSPMSEDTRVLTDTATIPDSPQAAEKPWAGCDGAMCALAHAEAAEPLLPEAQRRWAARPLSDRLQVVRAARHWMAVHPQLFAQAITADLQRSEADTLVAELLPLLDAMRFLERQASRVLAPRRLGRKGRPVWLLGVSVTLLREPLGRVVILGPANFPLFLPGVQAIQALVAGNAVTWKPGEGGQRVALLFSHVLREAGLPRGILHVTDESPEAGRQLLAEHPDKVFLTGSFDTGQHVLSSLAKTAVPVTMELSGSDAVIVLPSADLALAAKAITFGLRLNGSEVCMSPRRLVATGETMRELRPLLMAELAQVAPVKLRPRTAERLHDLLEDALQRGAKIVGAFDPSAQKPLLLERATPDMAATRNDIFAPVLSVLSVPSALHMAEVVNQSPLGLTAAIFGDAHEAEILAAQLRVGTVLINDLIAPTADPRVPFGGRGRSGFGVTRGAEGLLEMTASKAVLSRRKGLTRHYQALGRHDVSLFTGVLGLLHGGSLAERWRSLLNVVRAAQTRSAS